MGGEGTESHARYDKGPFRQWEEALPLKTNAPPRVGGAVFHVVLLRPPR